MYSLNKIRPHIWHIEMDCRYELGMTFLRASEFYESANPDFRGKLGWTLLDHMKWYSTSEDSGRGGKYGDFSFASDWGGYNVPGSALDALYPRWPEAIEISDWNEYDERLLSFLRDIRQEETDSKYYLIGTLRGEAKGFLGHELAHAYYSTDGSYKCEMDSVLLWPPHKRAVSFVKVAVKALGYCDDVLDDEVQAYCATGFPGAFAGLAYNKDVIRLVKEIGQVFAHWEKKYNG